jgi:hypothetical protein
MGQWVAKEKICAFRESVGIPGSASFAVDWCDSPDRYFIANVMDEPLLGMRRLSRFAGYPVTQYYILERKVEHECLKSDGGSGMTYLIRKGLNCFARKNWRLCGSFYAFDMELRCSNKYTVYTRNDPFPRMQVCMGNIAYPEQWTADFSFYAFDIPLPGSCVYMLQHCVRSIKSTEAGVSRHRMTMLDAQMPWEFRFNMFVMPAGVEDVTLVEESDVPLPVYEEYTEGEGGAEYFEGQEGSGYEHVGYEQGYNQGY